MRRIRLSDLACRGRWVPVGGLARVRPRPAASSRLAMKLDRWSGVGFQAELSWTEIRFTSMTYLLRRPRPNFPKAGLSLRRPVSGQFWLHRCFVKELQSGQFMYADRK